MTRHRIVDPYWSLVGEACVRTEYDPVCTTKEGSIIFQAGNTKAKSLKKAEVCSNCIVRAECLADGINDMLSRGRKPSTDSCGGFRAGLSEKRLVEIGVGFYELGVTSIGVNQAEAILYPTPVAELNPPQGQPEGL